MDRTSRNFVSVLLKSSFLVVLAGCTVSLGRDDVIGSWECRRGARVSCVDVHNDNTYSQLITANGISELSTTSTWSWELKAGEGTGIVFKGFHHIADDGSEIRRPPGFWIVVPERTAPFGAPKLVVSDDISIAYTKRDSPCPR